MTFESNLSILYSDVLVPEVFITEYMPSMDGGKVKIYIYCLFLSRRGKHAYIEDISKKLELEEGYVNNAIADLEALGLLVRKDNRIVLSDIKEKEIHRLFRPKTASTPEEAVLSSDRNKKRSKVIRDINNKYFQGVMSPSWYTDIDLWFDEYGFEEDVMFALFEHCSLHNALTKPYIVKVADNWHSKNIKNSFDLDRYSMEYQKIKDIRLKIVKKMRKRSNLTEYEEAYVEKWVAEYGYDFDIIEMALKRTTFITNPNFEYINKILTDWHQNGLKTKEAIAEYEMARKQKAANKTAKAKGPAVPQKGNFEQRKYEDDFFDKVYKL
jgi:DnaD/phage-associated family protein